MSNAGQSGNAEEILLLSGNLNSQIGSLFKDNASSSLYFKVSYYCNDFYTVSIFKSDGTTAGTVNLRGDNCTNSSTSGGSSGGSSGGPSDAEYWGVLFLAALPMLILASFILVTRKMPGLFANLYGGVAVVFLIIFLLVSDNMDNLFSFNKWFFTIYSSVLWVAIIVVSILKEERVEWLEEMKSWAVTLVAGTFFIIIHFDLEVPFTNEAWAWVVYGVLALLQMMASVVVSRTFPMVCGAISAFVLSYKISWEVVQLLARGGWGSQLELLTVFGLMALQGIGIILLAIVYASRRSEIELAVRSVFKKWKVQKAPMQESSPA